MTKTMHKQTLVVIQIKIIAYYLLYNNQINAHALIGQSAMGYCAGKPMGKLRVFWDII